MFCNKCGKPLPNDGFVCKFCGAMMSKEQLQNNINQQQENNSSRPELKTEKFGNANIEFRDNNESENKMLGLIIVGGIVLFIIVLAIIINVMR